MQKFIFCTLMTILLVGWSNSLKAQAGIFDPNDPDRVGVPATPPFGQMAKWGHANRLTWSGQTPFQYGYKSYYYKFMPFRLKFPKTYQHNVADGKKYPLFIFFHGLGERGEATDNEYSLLHGGRDHATAVNNGVFDGFLMYPQSANGFMGQHFPSINEIIDSLAKYVKVDIDRVIISGLSSGAQGVWDYMGTSNYARKVAGIIPISGAQGEDKAAFPNYITVPVWTTNGGLDLNPAPETVTDIINTWRNLGGTIKQTYFPFLGHGVWNQTWAQPTYFPYLSTPHKANPLVYFERTEFCPGATINVRLGLHAGFSAYQWEKDGVVIPGATTREITVTSFGTYRARFRRTATGPWSDWSPTPVVIKEQETTITPPIQVDGLFSNVLPSPDGNTTVPLTVPGEWTSYEWRRVSDNSVVSNSQVYNAPVGQYRLTVTEQFGCSTSPSPIYTVLNSNGNSSGKPDKPTNPTAVPLSATSVKLDWNDNPNPTNDETAFEIYRSQTSGGPYSLVRINPANNRTYTDPGLSSNTTYFYIIRAVNANGSSANSDEASSSPVQDLVAPTAPGNLRITSTSSTALALAWNPSSDNIGTVRYDIYVNGVKSYVATGTSFTLNAMENGQYYNIIVKGIDAAGNTSPASNQITGYPYPVGFTMKYYTGNWTALPNFATLTPVAQGAVTSISLSGAGVPTAQDNFGCLWEGWILAPTTGSYIFRLNSDDGSRLWLSEYNFSNPSLVDNDGEHLAQDRDGTVTLTAGVAYRFTVGYFNRTGPNTLNVLWRTPGSANFVTIPTSAYRGAAPNASNPPPPIITGLTAVSAGYDRINLSWSHTGDETGFEIWRSASATSGYLPVGTLPANTFSHVDSFRLLAGGRYYYQVKAIGLTGESALAPAAGTVSAVTAVLPTIPGAPTVLTASPLSTSQTRLLWNDNATNEQKFEIWRSVGTNTAFRILTTIGANSDAQGEYIDTDLFANTAYFYRVRAIGVGGTSAYSNDATTSTGNNLPVITNIPNFTMRYGSSHTLNIIATDADGGNVTISATNVPAFGVFSSTGNGTGQIVFNPSSLQTGAYNIGVSATDANGGVSNLNFTLTVNSNYVPVITPVSNININENANATVNLSANDQDGNGSLVWSASGLPSFVTLTPGSNGAASLSLDPSYAHAGVYPVSLTVNDGSGGISSVNVTITVNNIELINRKWYLNMAYTVPTGSTPPWNNINGTTVNNLRDENNQVTTVDFQIMQGSYNAFNNGAVTGNNSGVYEDNVMRDYYYFGIFGNPETVDVRLSSLDPASRYTITLFASSVWSGVPDNGTTVYTINGVSQSIYVQNNRTNTVTFSAISPNASGQITITMSKAPGTPVGYLNAMVIEQGTDDGTVPVLPQNLVAQNLPNGNVRLTWTDIAYNEQAYRVYRSATLNGTYSLLPAGTVANNVDEFTDNTVGGLTTYFYKIEATNNHGTSGLTNAVSITTTNKSPVVNAITDVNLKSTTSTSVVINSSDDAGETLTTNITNLPSFATFVDAGNGDGTININPGPADIGTHRNIKVAVTDNFGSTTERIFSITVTDNQTRSFFIDFAGEAGATEGRPWNNIVSYPFAGITSSNLRDDLDAPSTYTLTLVDGWTSSWYGGMLTGNNSGLYPDNVIKSSVYEQNTGVKRLRFSGLNPAKVYNIAVFSSNNAGFNSSFTLASQGKTLLVDPRFNSVKNAQLNALVPDASGVIEFTMSKEAAAVYMFLNAVVLQEYDGGQLIRPVDMMAEINAPGLINLSWSDRSNIETGYEIWRATSGTAFSLLTTTAANVNTYTDNTAQKNIRYYYKVRALNGGAQSEFSNVANKLLGSNLILMNLGAGSVSSQGSPWNNARVVPLGGSTFNNLINNSAVNTGVSMRIENDWGGNFDLGMSGTGVLPSNVMRDSWWVEGGGPIGTLRLSNLHATKRYRIGIMGSSSWVGDFTASYTIGDKVVYLNAYQNSTKCVYIDDVQANNLGQIFITMGTLPGARWGFWSAITIESYDDDSNKPGPLGTPPTITYQGLNEGGTVETTTAPTENRSNFVEVTRVNVNEVKVFPNPFNESLTIKVSTKSSQKVSVKLVDISGRIIVSRDLGVVDGVRNLTITSAEIGKVSAGTYMLQMVTDGKVEKSVKLIKTK